MCELVSPVLHCKSACRLVSLCLILTKDISYPIPFFTNVHSLSLPDCLIGACVQCCNDPTCAPHSEAREQLKRKKAILDGTNVITELAKKKRASKVTPGLFHDTSIEYFGETAVLWNVGEFLENTKLREDAMRRCRRKTATVQSKRESENKVGGGRAKRFKYIHEQLYQKSLQK
jgi:hypothetical protein